MLYTNVSKGTVRVQLKKVVVIPDLFKGLLEPVGLRGHPFQLGRVQLAQLIVVLAQRPLFAVQRLKLIYGCNLDQTNLAKIYRPQSP